jgi:hypothetical protein
LVKCNIYQTKYDWKSNLTYSGHFLKYATLASHLELKPSDTEVIEAIRYHFPINVQRIMLGTQLQTIGDALNLLKRVELMEGNDSCSKQTYGSQQNQNSGNYRLSHHSKIEAMIKAKDR